VGLRPGARLRSPSGGTEVVVVRAPANDVSLDCAGEVMTTIDPADAPATPTQDADADGVLLGKRYEHATLGVEVLCTKAGAGPLTIGEEPLVQKGAKPLPSSD
jgi:hypothetical protein